MTTNQDRGAVRGRRPGSAQGHAGLVSTVAPGWGGGGGGGSNLPVIPRDPINDTRAFDDFGCDVPVGSPSTPDERSPDVTIDRDVYMRESVKMPDGQYVEVWGFRDSRNWNSVPFPSELIRVRQGQLVHTRLSVRRQHTIHHHGIEPTAFNDGVGHTSFEVDRDYTYQWYASQAGTYFYHCHVNTVLHFEMGMYGFLIVDPPEGPGRLYSGGPTYDVEALWAADEIDPSWHDLRWDAGRDQCPFASDVGLDDFNPQYFLISGVGHPDTRTDPRVVVEAQVGQTVLLRVLNAGYNVQRYTLAGLDAEVHGVDGRPLVGPYSTPFTVAAGSPFELTTAQRWDLIVQPTTAGSYPVTVEFFDWVSGAQTGVAETFIHVI